MTIDSVKAYLKGHFGEVEKIMRSSLGSDIPLLNSINDRVLSSGGKRLRPLLCLLIGDATGQINESTYKFAAACEILHNATLLHDDVADDSPSRRGIPTVYSAFGPAASVLVGDFWLVKAMDTIMDDPTCAKEIMSLFAKTLSSLAEGEMLQMQKAETLDTCFDDYLRIIYCKTASLFEAVALSATISVGASKEIQDKMMEYARILGYAFQMKDDIFDYIPSSQIGKEVGVDILEKKITLPLIKAIEKAPAGEAEKIIDVISGIGSEHSRQSDVLAFVEKYDGIASAYQVLADYVAKAHECLEILPESQAKEYLGFITDYVGNREL